MNRKSYALSIRQPWSGLILAGHKTIEVRTWPTSRRGRIFLHAGRLPDLRSQELPELPADPQMYRQLYQGLIGSVEIVDCIRYSNVEQFEADQNRHWNLLEWYKPGLFGFVLQDPIALPFVPLPGNTSFFEVSVTVPPPEGEQPKHQPKDGQL